MTWLDVPAGSPFGPAALPYGVVVPPGGSPRLAVRVGEAALDLSAVADTVTDTMIDAVTATGGGAAVADLLRAPSLDPLLAAGPAAWEQARELVRDRVHDDRWRAALEPHVHPLADVTALLPFTVADYVDFYSSRHHAENLGAMFRPGQPALTPNWRHLPIGYHGRSGTVVVSGTDVVRPCGQRRPPDADAPVFGPSVRLDIEAEVGFVVGAPTRLGSRVAVTDLPAHVFGAVLVNDWSARDVQAWEYQPLGPFLGKSFATSVSAWVLPLDALDAARVPPPPRDLPLLDYLRDDDPRAHWGLDLTLEVELDGVVVSRPPFRDMYWTAAQQLAHLTVNGASLRTGDLFASGTVSGPGRDERGSFIELTWNGTEPLAVGDRTVTFLEDGASVVLRATAPGPDGARVGLGEVTGRILPAAP